MAQHVFDDMFLTEVTNDVRVRFSTEIELCLHVQMCLPKLVGGHKLEVPFTIRALVTEHLRKNGLRRWHNFVANVRRWVLARMTRARLSLQGLLAVFDEDLLFDNQRLVRRVISMLILTGFLDHFRGSCLVNTCVSASVFVGF